MKRFIISSLLAAVMLIMLAGCHGEKQEAANPEDAAFLACTDNWYHYNEVTGENEIMSFRQDFTFYWGCECGEPVGDSDVYDLFKYDKESQVITIYNGYDELSRTIKVIDYSDYYLLLEIDGEITGFAAVDPYLEIPEAEKYLENYDMQAVITGGDSEKTVTGPVNYDGDVEYPENAFNEFSIAEDAVFYDLSIRTEVVDGEVDQDIDYEKVSREDAAKRTEQEMGFFWFNDDLEIVKIVYYGETRIEE